LAAGNPAAATQSAGKGSADCPNVTSALVALTQAAQPLDVARSIRIPVRNGKIQVVLGMRNADTDLSGFGVEVTSRSAGQAQAFVSVEQLCPLARSGDVTFIRLAPQAVPEG
jgi:hypothetical protein